jgi:hypothetical protein
LIELGHLGLGAMRCLNQIACLLYGYQILIY